MTFFFCRIGLKPGLIFNQWVITSGFIPGMSLWDNVNTPEFALQKFSICARSS